MKHCIYSKVTREEKRPWGCEPLSEACLRGYCPERVDAKKLKGLVDNALDPEVRMRRTRGCERPPEKNRGGRHVTSSSQPEG